MTVSRIYPRISLRSFLALAVVVAAVAGLGIRWYLHFASRTEYLSISNTADGLRWHGKWERRGTHERLLFLVVCTGSGCSFQDSNSGNSPTRRDGLVFWKDRMLVDSEQINTSERHVFVLMPNRELVPVSLSDAEVATLSSDNQNDLAALKVWREKIAPVVREIDTNNSQETGASATKPG